MMTADHIAVQDAEPETKEVQITYDEAMGMAREALSKGEFDWPEQLFRHVLEKAPDDAEATHYLGVLLHKKNQTQDGLARVEASLRLQPENPGYWNNYGLILRSLDRYGDAIDAFKRSIELESQNPSAYCNLGLIHVYQKREDIAEACFNKALEISDRFVMAYNNLASLRLRQGRLEESVQYSCASLIRYEKSSVPRRLLGYAYTELGQLDKAREVYEEWLRESPDDVVAMHHYAAINGGSIVRASDAYVQKVFDTFANSFDSKLALLEYRAPEIVVGLLAAAAGEPKQALQIADLGCGTGLCGPGAKPYAAQLIGVDLSSGMLAKAEARGCYDACLLEELTQFCMRHEKAFDAIICADTLCYFGDLSPAFAGVAHALRPNGVFVFTVEEAAGDAETFKFHHHGRFSHAERYVRDTLQLYNLKVETLKHSVLRMESGRPVHGLAVQVRL